jgi:hypothetical protein
VARVSSSARCTGSDRCLSAEGDSDRALITADHQRGPRLARLAESPRESLILHSVGQSPGDRQPLDHPSAPPRAMGTDSPTLSIIKSSAEKWLLTTARFIRAILPTTAVVIFQKLRFGPGNAPVKGVRVASKGISEKGKKNNETQLDRSCSARGRLGSWHLCPAVSAAVSAAVSSAVSAAECSLSG